MKYVDKQMKPMNVVPQMMDQTINTAVYVNVLK